MSWRTKHAPQEIDGKWWDAECARIFNELAKIGATTLTISKSEGGGAFWYQLGNETPPRVEAAALIMKEALENLENDDGAIPPSAWEMVQAAIERAGGTPKGPPETNIRAEVAALRQSLAWAMGSLREGSQWHGRAAAVCWNAIESDRGYSARLLVKAVTMPATDAPDHATDLAVALIEQPLLERIAALRASLTWAINTFQGESGLGDNYWEQFPEYLAACALLADANTQPQEEAP